MLNFCFSSCCRLNYPFFLPGRQASRQSCKISLRERVAACLGFCFKIVFFWNTQNKEKEERKRSLIDCDKRAFAFAFKDSYGQYIQHNVLFFFIVSLARVGHSQKYAFHICCPNWKRYHVRQVVNRSSVWMPKKFQKL